MGPGDRFQVSLFKGVMFGIQYNRWPYRHSFTVGFLCFNIFIGLGPSYIDEDF